jgi:tripartite-type tricarboxylate transporter receptor subunit TctC
MPRLSLAAVCAAMLLTPVPAYSQAYPNKPIRLIVPFAPGSGPDISSRRIANELSRQVGQQVLVDKRVGATGIIGTELIARATPDGYTLGYGTVTSLATNPSMFAKLPYDAIRDFQPVATFLFGVIILAVSPSLPVRSVKELIEHAGSNPGKLTYATTAGELCMELFKFMTGTQLVAIQYKAGRRRSRTFRAGKWTRCAAPHRRSCLISSPEESAASPSRHASDLPRRRSCPPSTRRGSRASRLSVGRVSYSRLAFPERSCCGSTARSTRR